MVYGKLILNEFVGRVFLNENLGRNFLRMNWGHIFRPSYCYFFYECLFLNNLQRGKRIFKQGGP